MRLEDLYKRAWNQHIEIDDIPMRKLRAISFPENWVAMDSSKYENTLDFKCDLAHEIGHCETGSFYNIHSPYDLKAQCEHRADKRAVQILIPYDELKQALREGFTTPWALAEYFDVTQDFVTMALHFYSDKLQGIDPYC